MKEAGLMIPLALAAVEGCCGIDDDIKDGRPNIVVILADDLGYSDLGCYGSEINTPNIDALAEEGIRYTQFYSAARSCPTRAGLLTGLYPHQAGIGHMVVDEFVPGYRGTLQPNTVTIAEMLKSAGYSTAMAGKWHVTNNTDPKGDISQWPMQRGFDMYYGTLTGHGSFWDPKCLFEGNDPVKAEGDFYYTEAITEKSMEFISEMSESDSPFFLYVAYTAPHYPLHARQEYIDKYMDIYSAGWDSLRVARYERMKSMGILKPDICLPPADEQCYAWSDEEHKEWQQMRMAVFAAMVEQMDMGVGAIIEHLREIGELDNTLIMFMSDNGPSNEGHLFNTVERLGTQWNDRMIPELTRDGRPVRAGDWPGEPLGQDDTYGSYGPQWAHLSATPFKRYKSWMHEGGICVPFVVSWKGYSDMKPGFRNGVCTVYDLMPTFMELAKGEYPDSIRGLRTIPPAGISIVDSFAEDVMYHDRVICWEHEGNRAIRKGKWKLVSEYPGSWSSLRIYPKEGEWELYDMSEDRTELYDLSMEYPEIVKKLSEEWYEWAAANNVRVLDAS